MCINYKAVSERLRWMVVACVRLDKTEDVC
jgi:hypothetical protein